MNENGGLATPHPFHQVVEICSTIIGKAPDWFKAPMKARSRWASSKGPAASVVALSLLLWHVELHNHKNRDVTVGSIEGDGLIFIGGSQGNKNLIVGGNNLDTIFSGQILGFSGGSLTKVGTGTLILAGANNYDETTTVKRGSLLVNNTTGSATGNSTVQVNGGTLGGKGIIAGNVTIGDGIGRAAFLSPGINQTSTSTLTLQSGLTFNSDGAFKVQLNSTSAKADKVVVAGVLINSGAQFKFSDVGSGTLGSGTVFTIINNTGPQPIAGTFSNLADGTTFTSNGNTFRANYEGGDGNDLTLIVQ